MNKESFFLIFVAFGVFLVSLSYLIVTSPVIGCGLNLKSISAQSFAFATFWIAGAKYENLRIPALWSLTIFMTGLALGRALSIAIDGIPYPLFIIWMIIEFISACLGYKFIRDLQKD